MVPIREHIGRGHRHPSVGILQIRWQQPYVPDLPFTAWIPAAIPAFQLLLAGDVPKRKPLVVNSRHLVKGAKRIIQRNQGLLEVIEAALVLEILGEQPAERHPGRRITGIEHHPTCPEGRGNRTHGWIARHVFFLKVKDLVVQGKQLENIQGLGSEFRGRIDGGGVSVKTWITRFGVGVGSLVNGPQKLQVVSAGLERDSLGEDFLQKLLRFRAPSIFFFPDNYFRFGLL